MSEWHSVNDRLPELDHTVSNTIHSEAVLVVVDGEYDIGSYVQLGWRAFWHTDAHGAILAEVTHWMPLPELPTKPPAPATAS